MKLKESLFYLSDFRLKFNDYVAHQATEVIPPKAPKTLKDLAYDSDKRLGYTIYIPENGKLEPYLVLTKNYYKQGNVC